MSGVNRGSESAQRPRIRVAKFVAIRTHFILLELSSSHPYQPLVLISTAQCNAGLRRKRVSANPGTITVTSAFSNPISRLSPFSKLITREANHGRFCRGRRPGRWGSLAPPPSPACRSGRTRRPREALQTNKNKAMTRTTTTSTPRRSSRGSRRVRRTKNPSSKGVWESGPRPRSSSSRSCVRRIEVQEASDDRSVLHGGGGGRCFGGL